MTDRRPVTYSQPTPYAGRYPQAQPTRAQYAMTDRLLTELGIDWPTAYASRPRTLPDPHTRAGRWAFNAWLNARADAADPLELPAADLQPRTETERLARRLGTLEQDAADLADAHQDHRDRHRRLADAQADTARALAAFAEHVGIDPRTLADPDEHAAS